jgi:DNA ligase (NAD+)
MSLIERIIDDPINTLKTLNTLQIVQVLEQADEAFFNSNKTLLNDDIYDIVKGYLKKKDPKNPYLKKVGAEITLNKEKLPYYLGSLDKIKDNEAEIIKWNKKYVGEYVVSEKLDGISCLLQYNKGEAKMWTRGDGYEGQNITHILPYLHNINMSSLTSWGNQKIAIRGELIISKANWMKISDVGANARNVVAGVLHSKTINTNILSKVDFIAYDMMFPRQKLSASFDVLKSLQFPLVNYIQSTSLTLDMLSNTLQTWRKQSLYEIDGIVVYHNDEHKIMSGKNPKYAFAFKTILTHEQVEVIVEDVEWNVSKHRYLKPLVKFNEVNLAGVKIKQATGFNASYIEKNNIGPGSHIIIVRSGDVIPHILNVLTSSANGKPKMPEIAYDWNDTHVDIMLKGTEKNREQDIQAFTHFMNTLGIDGVKEGVITKLYDAGFDNLRKVIGTTKQDLLKIEGFKEKSADKIVESLKKINEVSCDKLMTASNVFGRGFGEKKLKLIMDEYSYIPNNKVKSLQLDVADITKIKGMAVVSAQQFIQNLPEFFAFYEELGIKCKKTVIVSPQNTSNSKLSIFKDKKIIFSGFRNKEYEDSIERHGGKIVSSISKTTDYLIVKDKNETTTKIQKAMDLGINIMTKEELEALL